ncbi:GntR family transcriptional regulator [soil metagenome]
MHVPLYAATADQIEVRIRGGEWSVGSRLPSERQFCADLAVSRTTLREALAELEDRGIISRHQGRGTFVSAPATRTDLGSFFSIGAALASQGKELTSEVTGLERIEAGRQIAADLGLLPGDPVVRLDRVRSVDGEPLYLETTLLSLDRFPGLLEADFQLRSLYEVLHTDYQCHVVTAVAEMLPVILTPNEATMLGVHRNLPALSLRRVTRDRNGAPVEVSEAFLRGDRARFVQHLSVETTSGPGEGRQLMTYAPSSSVPRVGARHTTYRVRN